MSALLHRGQAKPGVLPQEKGESMETIGYEELEAFFQGAADIFREKKEELCAMDAKMGDGDLGLTMEKGFAALPGIIRENGEPGNIGKTLMKSGMKMAALVPSTMGTLMASGIMAGGKAIGAKSGIGTEELVQFLSGFAEGIRKRGKCERGDRTILDALAPAADAAVEARNRGAGLAEIMQAARMGAEAGAEATRDMLPRFGKAAVFADKAKGTEDQGAAAGVYLMEGLERYFHEST